ncbi:MAG: hypothetical protein PHV85_05600, partial [Desulfovibrionaceae bacterium]|nr:hypothetical protein [Desulfovibrionaceae bacterium]
SKGDDLVGLPCKLIKIVHPGYGAGPGSHKTVGLHAHASDIKITFEFIDLLHDIELFAPAGLEQDSPAEHEYAYLVAFFQADVRKTQRIVDGFPDIGRNDEQNLHGKPPLTASGPTWTLQPPNRLAVCRNEPFSFAMAGKKGAPLAPSKKNQVSMPEFSKSHPARDVQFNKTA